MIRWKVQLHPMRRLLVNVFLALFLCCLCGCQKDMWTNEEWFIQVALQGGFSINETKALQDFKSFDLVQLDENSFDESLTFATVIQTCNGLLEDYDKDELYRVLNVSAIKDEKVLSADQSKMLLDWLIHQLNTFEKKTTNKVTYVSEPIKVDAMDRIGDWILCEQTLFLNDLIDINGIVYEVVDLNEEWCRVEEADYQDVIDMDLSGSMDLDLNKSEITVKNEIVEVNEELKAGMPAFSLSKTIEIGGFKVRFSTSSDSLHIYASKKLDSGLPIFAQFDINKIHCDFKWKANQDEVSAAGLKVSYETSFTSGLRTTKMNDRILDFSKLNSSDLMNSLNNAFVPKSECLETTLELAEIQIPFPEMPACVLKMKVLLHLYASGKVDISFENDQVIGFEKMNGKIRYIHESEKDSYVSFRASGKASTQLKFILSILSKDCMDAGVDFGIEGNAESKLSLIDTGKMINTDLPYEIAEELANSSDKMLACADLDANWLLKLALNSHSTLLGSFGFGKTFTVLNEANGSLFGKKIHFENFQQVEQCTRKTKNSVLPMIELSLDRIELKNYLLVLNKDQKGFVHISSLPDGISYSDVIFTSSDSKVAEVSSSGIVTGIDSGQCFVKVSLKDGSNAVQCSIFVR
ncbi:MAG: Ig-like domain-containing protein [Erysipelotrichaceae bacterium]|nr:Ig-like domain-containing protein [Erysipelotrichaceae bacterium]